MNTILMAAAAATLLAGAAHAAPPVKAKPKAGPTDVFSTAVRTAHSNLHRVKADKFADVSDQSEAVGKAFKVQISPKDGDAVAYGSIHFFWTYKDGKLRLDLPANPVRTDGPILDVFITGERQSHGPAYVGSNAFGVTKQVTDVRVESDAIGSLSRPDGDYELAIPATGAVAKRLTTEIVAIVEGTIQPMQSGKVTGCEVRTSEATINFPERSTTEVCFAAADISRVAFVNKTTGEILKEWTEVLSR